MAVSLLQKKTFCLITGASRGLGKSIAEKFVAKFPTGSTILLLARSVDKLEKLADTFRQSNPNINVIFSSFDQSNLNQCSKETLENILKEANIQDVKGFEQAMIVHNAASQGDITKYAVEMTDKKMVEETMNANVTGAILLNGSFWSIFTKEMVGSRVVINITSMTGLLPFPSLSLYCTVKAARDMFFLTLAKENPDIRVLTYGPGGMNTDMAADLMLNSFNDDLRNIVSGLQKSGKLLESADSADKMITLLEANIFESGKHIEITDVQ